MVAGICHAVHEGAFSSLRAEQGSDAHIVSTLHIYALIYALIISCIGVFLSDLLPPVYRLQFHPSHLDRWILNILSLLCLSNIYFSPSKTEERIMHLSCCIHQWETRALFQRILELMSLLSPSPSCRQGP